MARPCWALSSSCNKSMRIDPEIDAPPAPPPSGAAERLAALLSQTFGVLSVLSILAMLMVTAINVFGRYFLGSPLRGAEEMTGFLVVATVMFGAAEAHRRGEHISIDVIEGALPPALRPVMTIIGHLAVIVFAVTMAWTGWETVLFSRSFGVFSPGYTETPMWIVQLPLVAGGALLAIIAALKIVAIIGRRA